MVSKTFGSKVQLAAGVNWSFFQLAIGVSRYGFNLDLGPFWIEVMW